MNYLITIIGPTAIGKTSLSIALAQHYGCEIISCDSRQFFQEMTLGTAVPNEQELASVVHHFIQNKSIFDKYTVGDFERDATTKLDLLFLKNSGNNQSSIKNVDCLSIEYTSIINPFSDIGFLKKGMSFIKEHKKDDAQNIIYNYQYPNIRNFLLILYAKLKRFKFVFDLIENKEYEIPKT